MAREFFRTQRVAKEIQKEIAIIFHREIQDPRVKMATVSGVEVSRDLSFAKVFVTFLDISEKKSKIDMVKNSMKVLNGDMAKHIRALLGKAMRLRVVPELTFFYDSSLMEGIYITKLVSKVMYDHEKHCDITKK